MAVIIPEGAEAPVESNQLEIDDAKRAEMIAKATEILDGKPMEFNTLMKELEQHYIKIHEHYTSMQLKSIVTQVQLDNAPQVDPALT